MKKRYIVVVLAMVAMAILALTACTGGDVVSSDITDGKPYTVSFVVDGKVVEKQAVGGGSAFIKPIYKTDREWYDFLGWYYQDGKAVDWDNVESRKFTENVTVIAKYKGIEHTITYYLDENTIGESLTAEHGSLLAQPTVDVQKTGYTFEGWFDADGKPADFEHDRVTGDKSFTARYRVAAYTVRFFIGENQLGETQKPEYGDCFELPNTDGYISEIEYINGWRKNDESTIYNLAATDRKVDEDTDFYAVVAYKAVERIELVDFATQTVGRRYKVSESAEVVLHFADQTQYTLDKAEYAIDVPKDFGDEFKTYALTVRVLVGNGGQTTLSVAVVKNTQRLSVLFIGNSFSDDTIAWAYKTAKSAGVKDIEIADLYIGGCTIETHVSNTKTNSASYIYRCFDENGKLVDRNNSTMLYGIKDKNWDYIVLQQGSAVSGVQSSYAKIGELIDYVKANATNPEVRLMFNMTWAYKQGSPNGGFANYDRDQQKMYNAIVSAVQSVVLPNKEFSIIIPNGTAIQNTRTSFVGDTLVRDNYDHLTMDYGRYIAALTFVSATTGISVDDIPYAPAGLAPGYTAVAKESVKNALNKPFEITQSQHKEKIDYTIGKQQKQLTFTMGYYNSSVIANPLGFTRDIHFYATEMFTRADIPVGSIIYIADGWRYRPEGWINGAANTNNSRPGEVTMEFVEVTEEWWGEYTQRAFNVSIGWDTDLSNRADELKDVFKIFLPE